MRAWFPMAMHLLEGLFIGMRPASRSSASASGCWRSVALSAGLTHELNNPAAAAVRATADAARAGRRDAATSSRMLAHGEIDAGCLQILVDVQEEAVERMAKRRS